MDTSEEEPDVRVVNAYGRGWWPGWVVGFVVLAIAVNVTQFAGIDRALPPTWKAITRAADSDLPAVAIARDDSGVVGLQFSLALALRQFAPQRNLILSDELQLEGALSLELLTGLGQVACVEQRPLDQVGLSGAVPTDRAPIAASEITAARHRLLLVLDDPVGSSVLLLDAREQRGEILLVDAGLLPGYQEPEPSCR